MAKPIFQRAYQCQIPSDDPFKNDCLKRKPIIENLTRLLESTTQPYVLSVEASWGFGKTTFVRMWQQYLINNKFIALYFNAWENDFVDDPLSAFISSITAQISKVNDELSNHVKMSEMKKIGGKIIKKTIPIALAAITRGALSSETYDGVEKFLSDGDIAALVEETAESQIVLFEKQKKAIEEFKKVLDEITKLLENKQKLPLVIFVDELDRCRPDFALSLLERMKHLFNVDGVFFVLSVDRDQLENSVKAIYGKDLNANGYLRRFIDQSIFLRLEDVSPREYAKVLFNRFDMYSVLQKINCNPKLHLEMINLIATHFSFSLRKIEQCVSEINLVLRIIKKSTWIQTNSGFITLLILLKALDASIYEQIRNKDIEVFELLEKEMGNLKYSYDLDWGWYYGLMYPKEKADEEIARLSATLQEYNIDTGYHNDKDLDLLRRKIEGLSSVSQGYSSTRFDQVAMCCNHIEFISMFMEE